MSAECCFRPWSYWRPWQSDWIAGGAGLLLAGIFGSWDLTLWIVKNRAKR